MDCISHTIYHRSITMKKQKKPVPPAEAEPVIKKQPLLKRLLFGPERPDLSELEAGSTTILDILSPTAIDTKSRDYIVVDGVFHAYLYITGYGYSTTVGSCWLAPLVEAGEGVNISFSFTRQNREKILSKIAQTTMLNRSRMRDVGDTRQDYEELDSAITSGLYLKDVMNRQGEDFYYMHTLIEVVADDPDTLEQRVTAVEKLCVSVDMIARRCDYANEQGFLSALPLVALDADIERKSRRNALTTGVAAAFPFVSYEHSDRNGIFLGLNLYNKSPVFLDPYDDYKYTNGNWWIGGNSGAGKSVTLQCLAGRLREQGKRVVCVIPKKGHEFRPNCEQLGGLYLRLSPSSRDCPNIMAIRRRTLDAYAGIQELAARDDSVLADKISRLIIWYSLQKKDLTEEDKNYLDASLVECYDRYGITFDNASVVDENGAFKEMPIIPDWYNVLLERAETKHLAVVLTRYVTGSAAAMGRRNHISIDNKYIVLDTSGMPDDLILPGIYWAIDVANDIIMNAGGELSALIADELWSLVGAGSNPLAAAYVQEMVKTIRGLGGIAITSTQGMQDLFSLEGGKYGKGILDSSRIKFVMQMEEQEARLIQQILNLSEEEVRQITRFRRGEGLLCIGYNHVPVAFHVTKKEYDAITTSPTDRQARKKGTK
jgi:conjugal transfer ATP-binding protein TraC